MKVTAPDWHRDAQGCGLRSCRIAIAIADAEDVGIVPYCAKRALGAYSTQPGAKAVKWR
jgi:hypothetical protein